ncbi:MAG: N-6 DNA methylase [Deltaproteobacteria bacterium]|nr:N-6 DNA methylase [Deltaproteobacteria bacterium]
MSRGNRQFSSVRTEGGLLPQDVLSRIQAGDKDLPGLTPESYHLGPHERIGEAVNRAWSRLTGAWRAFRDVLDKESDSSRATGLTRDRWLLPLFQELGYGRLPKGQAIDVDGKSFAVSHLWHLSPIHLLGAGVDLDRRQAGVAGAAKASPHGLVQEFLNRSEHHLWGFVSNGLQLRVLRDHHSLTRQAYVEFDIQAIMEGEQYSEFLLLWMVCHQSRVEADKAEDCWLETWFNSSRDEGVRALDKLRGGVEKAIESFGTGFLANRANNRLREALESGELDKQEYYRQVLRLVYRLIFLFVAEERDALLDPDADDAAKDRYLRFYATRRLRDLADKRRGGPHGDLWQGLRLVMSKLDDGCPELGLPALGSRLWGPTACPWLMDAECGNEHVLDAVRRISTIEEGRTRYSVNWRNVGADELGSIYEGLLELHPRMNKEAGTFSLETAAGHERKTTGSYYTPTPLVDCLLDSALGPLLDEAAKSQNPEEAILAIKVCDPACGSGHFLVAAARRIAKRLAAARAGEDEPSPREVRRALRDVVGRCIYGVDLNPMAVELCKVSLWMEAIEPGRPLSFLDSHIQCGNALLGTTPALMARGIPDEAFKALEGDDNDVAKALKKQNRNERAGQTTVFSYFAADPASGSSALISQAASVESEPDENIVAVRRKAADWDRLTRSPEFRDAWFQADAWCSAFMWPMTPGELEHAAVTEGLWRRIRRDPSDAPPSTKRTIRELSRRHGFFHWHLAFPQVFEGMKRDIGDDDVTGWGGGFSVVFGNPPWDTLSPDAKEFFSQYEPDIRFQDREGQAALIEQLLADSSIASKWEAHRRELYSSVHFMKASGRYTLFAPGNLGKGDFNVYRMFVETALRTVRDGGRASQVVPEGLYNGANCMAIRKELFERCELDGFLGFENNRQVWFDGIDGRTKFTIYSVRRPGRTEQFRVAFNIRSPSELAAAAGGGALRMPMHLVETFSPDALAIMEFGSQRDVDIAAKMYERHPKFGDETAGPPHRHYMAEIHMGNDRERFSEDPAGVPLYEGRMVSQYDHRAKGYRAGRGRKADWEDLPFSDPTKAIQPQWYIPVDDVPEKVRERYHQYRVGFCDVASPTNERTLVAALVPPGTICGDKVPTILFAEAPYAHAAWLAVANSFAMDFLARKKVSLKMSYTVVDSLPFPRFAATDEKLRFLVPRVLRLVCAGREMLPFWNAMAADGWVPPHEDASTVPGATDEDKRSLLQAEIDAYVAREVYGLTRDELAYVLDTFPIVEKRDVKAYGEYRTKRLVLDAFDQVAAPGPTLDLVDVSALSATMPTLAPAQEAAMCLWALVHAAGGSIPRIDLARAFALRSNPALLARLAPADLVGPAGAWAQRVAQRSVASGPLADTLRTLANRDGIRLATDTASRSVVTTSPHTPSEAQLDAWFRFEARLALRVLAALPAAAMQDVDSTLSDADSALLQAGGA